MELLLALIPLIAKLLMAIGGFAAVATVTPNSSNNKVLNAVLTPSKSTEKFPGTVGGSGAASTYSPNSAKWAVSAVRIAPRLDLASAVFDLIM